MGTIDEAELALWGQPGGLMVIVISFASCPVLMVGAINNTSLACSTLMLEPPFVRFLIRFQMKRKNALILRERKEKKEGTWDILFLLFVL